MPHQSSLSHPTPGFLSTPPTAREAELQASNDALVLAALSAQSLQLVAEQALHRQTQALALAAHELRNPLVPMHTVAALLERTTNLDELPRMGAVIARQVRHLSRLVDDLLDASRVATGKLHLRHGRVNLRDVFEEAIDVCRPAFDARRQRFVVNVAEQPMALDGDAVRLAQVFTNLLQNASKYTLTGGEIVLTCVLASPDGKKPVAVVAVSDNGIGISPETLPLIFEPFVQDPHAVGFSKDGLGIGLTLVRELVQAHAGSVTAESEGTGFGSRFVVTLPLA